MSGSKQRRLTSIAAHTCKTPGLRSWDHVRAVSHLMPSADCSTRLVTHRAWTNLKLNHEEKGTKEAGRSVICSSATAESL
ncbi:hypothetical protein RRG08_063453 [Elysia crispata]|uniref:Uncharacterized protein n=1 Tax=Elysia crispata TaxID=231223 RepID=A0AAE1ABV4_9GAST|nr:hypothetical protein RRG08_063453 [Elysia crispata]